MLGAAFVIVGAMLAPRAVWAQASPTVQSSVYAPERRVRVGAKLGLAVSDLSGVVTITAPDPMTGANSAIEVPPDPTERLSVGAYVGFAINPRYGVRIEALYAQRGAANSLLLGDPTAGGDMPVPSIDVDVRLDYLSVPILATYTFAYDGEFVYQLFAGPDVAYILDSEIDAGTLDLGNTDAVGDNVPSFDFGVTAGGLVKFPLPIGRLVIDARYLFGVTNAMDRGTTGPISWSNLRNRGFTLSAGVEY